MLSSYNILLNLSRFSSPQKTGDDITSFLFFIIVAFFAFFIFSIVHSFREKRKYEEEQYRRYLVRKEQEEQRRQKEIEWENKNKKVQARIQYEQSLVKELEEALSKLELSRKNSIKSVTLSKHIQEYSDFIDTFKTINPEYSHFVNARYTKPLEYAKNKQKKMLQNEEKLLSKKSIIPAKNQKRTYYPERNKLTKSLRYEILKRDNFRCCICGRSAEDNITLHVDHIFPVSKGGKTEPSNLRTLCSDCNLGKSDKIETANKSDIVSDINIIKAAKPSISKKESQTKEIQAKESMDNGISKEDAKKYLESHNIPYCDKTKSNGCFWVKDCPEIHAWILKTKIDGANARYCKKSKAFSDASAWYYK